MRFLITGGHGRLARELQPLLAGAVAPARNELDVTDPRAVDAAVAALVAAAAPGGDAVVVHAAAFTDVARAEREREACWRVNVLGTRHVAQACARHAAVLVHVSTDYVFAGDADPDRAARGGYREDDATGPARNHYAASKLAAEREARAAPRHLVLRTSFRPRAWPYATGFTDVRTSQTYVDELAPELALAVRLAPRIVGRGVHTVHVAGEPTTVFELARRRKPDVRPARKRTAGVDLPDDVVLATGLWQRLKRELG